MGMWNCGQRIKALFDAHARTPQTKWSGRLTHKDSNARFWLSEHMWSCLIYPQMASFGVRWVKICFHFMEEMRLITRSSEKDSWQQQLGCTKWSANYFIRKLSSDSFLRRRRKWTISTAIAGIRTTHSSWFIINAIWMRLVKLLHLTTMRLFVPSIYCLWPIHKRAAFDHCLFGRHLFCSLPLPQYQHHMHCHICRYSCTPIVIAYRASQRHRFAPVFAEFNLYSICA